MHFLIWITRCCTLNRYCNEKWDETRGSSWKEVDVILPGAGGGFEEDMQEDVNHWELDSRQ